MMSSHGVSLVPYLALKLVAGSDQPIFYSVSEEKVADVIVKSAGVTLTNTNCWATPHG